MAQPLIDGPLWLSEDGAASRGTQSPAPPLEVTVGQMRRRRSTTILPSSAGLPEERMRERVRREYVCQVGVVVSACPESAAFGSAKYERRMKSMGPFNGTYWPDPGARQYEGFSQPYRQAGGDGTLEFSDGRWYLSERYGVGGYFFRADAITSSAPPTGTLAGWHATVHGYEPAPTFSQTTRKQGADYGSPSLTMTTAIKSTTSPASVMDSKMLEELRSPSPLTRNKAPWELLEDNNPVGSVA